MYYKKLKINGVEYPLAVNISGVGAPTIDTQASVGMLYMDETNGEVWKLTPEGWVSTEVEIAQGIGKSLTAVMSQKAVTDELGALKDRVKYIEGATLSTIIDDTTAYKKSVPVGVAPYAAIEKIGGMTYKSVNIWNEQWELGSYGSNGEPIDQSSIRSKSNDYIPVEQSTDYYIYNGTSSWVVLHFYDANKQYISSAEVQSGIRTTPSNAKYMRFRLSSDYGTTYNNDICINKSNAAINGKYYPYFEGLRHAKVKAIESKGANLFDINNNLTEHSSKISDTEFTTDRNIYCIANVKVTPGVSYKIKCEVKDSGEAASGLSLAVINGQNMSYETMSKCLAYDVAYSTNYKTVELSFVPTSEWVSIVGVPLYMRNMMVVRSEISTESYIPYVGTIDTFTIPEEVRNREGYGLGLEGKPNTAKYANGRWKLDKQVKEIIIDGVFKPYNTYPNIQYYAFSKPKDFVGYSSTSEDFLIAGYGTLYHSNWESTEFVGVATGRASWDDIWIGFPIGTTLEEAQAALHGKSFVYALNTPETEDITDIMPIDNYIKVEGGGSSEAVNDYGYEVPSTIAYITKV